MLYIVINDICYYLMKESSTGFFVAKYTCNSFGFMASPCILYIDSRIMKAILQQSYFEKHVVEQLVRLKYKTSCKKKKIS